MSTARWILAPALALGVALAGYAQAPKPAEPKKEEPKRLTGQLPTYWKMLGLTDKQVQEVYKIQGKYNAEIDTLEAKIKELKEKMGKERLEVLTAEQKKRLEEILKDKAGTSDKKDK
jgi:Spy/CpxP family protein refolding chaperone